MVDPVGLIDGGGFDAPPGDPGALLRLADQLDKHAEDVFGLGHDTSRTTTDVRSRARWEGAASERYSAFADGAGSGIAGIHQPLSKIATHVRSYANALHFAQQRVAAARESAHAAVSGGAPDAASHATKAKGDAAQASASLQDAAEQSQSAIEAAIEELTRQWEATEPTRSWIEKIKAPWDAAGADVGLDKLIERGEKIGEAISDWEEALPGVEKTWFDQDVAAVAHEFDNGSASKADLDSAWQRFAAKSDAAKGFTDGWKDSSRLLRYSLPFLEAAKGLGTITGAVGDVGTLAEADDSALGKTKKVMAGTNLAGIVTSAAVDVAGSEGIFAADGALSLVPGVGQAALIGTGVFLGGEYLYEHWKPFHSACDAVGNATARAVKDVAHGVVSQAEDVSKQVASGVKGVEHGVSSATKALKHWFGM